VIRINGRVQNVGFRDRVLDIAETYRVTGSVRNVRAGEALEIDVEGEPGEVERFLDEVLANPPSFARVERVDRETLEPRGARGFTRAPTG
jgi:hydrogenase maturation protein HypF